MPAGVRLHWAALARFLTWLVTEGELERSPLAGLQRPLVDEPPPAILRDEDVAALLQACNGREFLDRRDAAILRFLLDTGTRRAELLGLDLTDVDLRERTAEVVGKGNRPGLVFFGVKTARDLDRYLRARSSAPEGGPARVLDRWQGTSRRRRLGADAQSSCSDGGGGSRPCTPPQFPAPVRTQDEAGRRLRRRRDDARSLARSVCHAPIRGRRGHRAGARCTPSTFPRRPRVDACVKPHSAVTWSPVEYRPRWSRSQAIPAELWRSRRSGIPEGISHRRYQPAIGGSRRSGIPDRVEESARWSRSQATAPDKGQGRSDSLRGGEIRIPLLRSHYVALTI